MDKVAFVFSGQGAQYPGMGRSLCAASPEAEDIFRRADAVRPGTAETCFEGTAEELARTADTQPCMFTVELAAAAALTAAGVSAAAAAGFSLGELAALTYAGAMSFEDGLRLVSLRASLMQEEAEKTDAAMTAVLKLAPEKVEELCARYGHVYPVNYNCPGQVTVSGLRGELEAFSADVKAAGGRAVPLRVGGGFHSPFMAGAAASFAAALGKTDFKRPRAALYADSTGERYGDDIAAELSGQMASPVLWQKLIESMIRDGVGTFIELGPGKTLCGFIKRISPDVRALHIEDAESLGETLRGVRGC